MVVRIYAFLLAALAEAARALAFSASRSSLRLRAAAAFALRACGFQWVGTSSVMIGGARVEIEIV